MKTFRACDILLPKKGIDLTRWSVVACDQYTQNPEYWDTCKAIAGDKPSTLNMVFPEAFLSQGNGRIEKINSCMEEYLKGGIFTEYKNSMIYVERTQHNGKTRKGIIGAVDLEDYDFSKGSKSLIRATEGTVPERIPPRVKIRENAILELPHVMLLIDDIDKTVIEPFSGGNVLYDFDLMQGGGHIKGCLMNDSEKERVLNALDELYKGSRDNLVFAVGDGNHSLATAKTCWENIKKTLTEDEIKIHPARFCLVEIENLYDDALEFEPIHRVVFDVSLENFLEDFKNYYPGCSFENTPGQHIKYISKDGSGDLFIENPPSPLAVGTLQKFIDDKGYKTDYIHGDDTVSDLCSKSGNIGFILPAMKKTDLFKAVIADGTLPRKTFSMGDACDKKYYLEAKKIK